MRIAKTMKLEAFNFNNGIETQIFTLKPFSQSPNRTLPIPLRVRASVQDLRGGTVAVIGLGKSGRSAVKLALARGASVVAIDQNENMGLLEEEPGFTEHSGALRTILGQFDRNLLYRADRVIVSPGVPLENYGLSYLGNSENLMVSELDFAAEIIPESVKILAVTGTNGKSTTVTFAGQMLSELGFETFVGGNIGTPLSEAAIQCLASESSRNKFQVAVVEVSSYQMEIPHKSFCPSVSVVLNLTPDHLDRHGTMKSYAMTKSRIFSNMNHSKLAILPRGNQHLDEAVGPYMNEVNLAYIGIFPGVKIDINEKTASLKIPALGIDSLLELDKMKMMGTHNYHNAAVAALSVLGLRIGVDAEAISSTIGKLKPPLHRMQIGNLERNFSATNGTIFKELQQEVQKEYLVYKDSNGVTWVDDSKATNVEATLTGLMGLKGQTSVILLGGRAKVLEGESNGFEQLVEPLNYHRCVVTFGESGEMICRTLTDHGLKIPCIKATSMVDAVGRARRIARHGDAIVLTPACLSFDEFKNFEHRGMVFQELTFS